MKSRVHLNKLDAMVTLEILGDQNKISLCFIDLNQKSQSLSFFLLKHFSKVVENNSGGCHSPLPSRTNRV